MNKCPYTKEKCCKCGEMAIWCYMPGYGDSPSQDYFCDKHVPRGCSCVENKNEPCREFWYDKNGWDK